MNEFLSKAIQEIQEIKKAHQDELDNLSLIDLLWSLPIEFEIMPFYMENTEKKTRHDGIVFWQKENRHAMFVFYVNGNHNPIDEESITSCKFLIGESIISSPYYPVSFDHAKRCRMLPGLIEVAKKEGIKHICMHKSLIPICTVEEGLEFSDLSYLASYLNNHQLSGEALKDFEKRKASTSFITVIDSI